MKIFLFILSVVLTLLLFLYLTEQFEELGLYLLISFILVILILLVNLKFNFSGYSVLFIIGLIPLVYLNNDFHYSFKLLLLEDVPFYLMILIGTFISFRYSLTKTIFLKKISTIKYLSVFLGYIILNCLYALYLGNDITFIVKEFYQFGYYFFVIFFLLFIKDERDFNFILSCLLIIFIYISIEFVLFNLFSSTRFVTFQSGTLPVFFAFSFATTLITKKNKLKRTLFAIASTILFLGLFLTLTRSIWIAVAIIILLQIYMVSKRNAKSVIFLLGLSVALLFFAKGDSYAPKSLNSENTIESKASTISNPVKDNSFLLRVEIAFHSIQKFLSKPILGHGLGDYMHYKILKKSNEKLFYPDNVLMYLIWKTGIVGLLLFSLVVYRVVNSAFYLWRYSSNKIDKILGLAMISIAFGYSFYTLLAPTLLKYKTNIIFAFLIAFVEYKRFIISDYKELNK